jgi:hypothetical protein
LSSRTCRSRITAIASRSSRSRSTARSSRSLTP